MGSLPVTDGAAAPAATIRCAPRRPGPRCRPAAPARRSRRARDARLRSQPLHELLEDGALLTRRGVARGRRTNPGGQEPLRIEPGVDRWAPRARRGALLFMDGIGPKRLTASSRWARTSSSSSRSNRSRWMSAKRRCHARLTVPPPGSGPSAPSISATRQSRRAAAWFRLS